MSRELLQLFPPFQRLDSNPGILTEGSRIIALPPGPLTVLTHLKTSLRRKVREKLSLKEFSQSNQNPNLNTCFIPVK